jgi:hypothetical protein
MQNPAQTNFEYLNSLTLSVPDPGNAGHKSNWWPYVLFLLIARLFVQLIQNQVQMIEN